MKMNKYFLLTLITLSINLSAEMRFNGHKAYTVPMTAEINQDEYHNIFLAISPVLQPYGLYNAPADRIFRIRDYLLTIGTPTAYRFLADMEKMLNEYRAFYARFYTQNQISLS